MSVRIADLLPPLTRLEPLGKGGGGEVYLVCRGDDGSATLVVKYAAAGQEKALEREWLALHDVPSALLPEPVAWLRGDASMAPAIVMTRRPGRTLLTALPDLQPCAIGAWMRATLRGLGALHAAGLVHGDLHPGNLLVGDDAGAATLLDLGLAQSPGEPVRAVGQPAFAAPDALRGAVADPRDDLFSLAMAVWLSWGFAPPYPNYPAVLPPTGARPQPADCAEPKAAMLRVLAGWLAPSRDHRPADAEQALREWQTCWPHPHDDAQDLAADLEAIRLRAWRWGRWSVAAEPPAPPADGGALWIVGTAGSGRSGVLTAQVLSARAAGLGAARVGPSTDADPLALAWCERGQRDPTLEARVEPALQGVLGALGDPGGAQVAGWQRRFDALRAALGAGGLLAVDDWEAWPAAARLALLAIDPAAELAAVSIASLGPPALEGAARWDLPAVGAAELAQSLQAASGGRSWDQALLCDLGALAGPSRAAALAFAAAALRGGVLGVAADRVEALDDAAWAVWVQQATRAQGALQLPSEDLWATLAHVALAGRCFPGRPGEILPQSARDAWRDTSLLRPIEGRGLETADAAARAWLLSQLPADLLASTARARAASLATADPQSVRLRLQAACRDGASSPDQAEVAAAMNACLGAAQAQDAIDLGALWWRGAGVACPGCGLVAEAQLRALASQGSFAAAADLLATLESGVAASPGVQVALAELAFRRGDYPEARACAERILACTDGDEATQAWIWLAFAATWQGDHPTAAAAIQSGRFAALGDARSLAILAYLGALQQYYAGHLDSADAVFARLAEADSPSLRAAAAGGRGLCAHRRGDLALARGHYERARSLAEMAGDRSRSMNMTMNVAVLDHELGDLGRALSGYDRVVARARQLGNSGALQRALQNRGNLLTLLGMDAEARSDLDAVLRSTEAAGNAYLEGNVRCLLAEIERRGDRWQHADGHLRAAKVCLEQADAHSELLEIKLEDALLRQAQGDLDAARSVAREVRLAAAKLGSPELQARALWLEGTCRLDLSGAEPTQAELLGLQDDLRSAWELAPAAKPLLRVAIGADRSRVAALSGNLAQARQLALEQLASLERVEATVDPVHRRRFLRATCHAVMRNTLKLLSRLPVGPAPSPAGLGRTQLHPVLAINRRLGGEHELDALLEIVMDAAVLLTGAERGFLLLDEAGDREEAGGERPRGRADLRVAVARNLDRENLRKPQHKLSQTIAHRVFETGERVLSTDAQADERWREQASIHAGSLRSILCVPLTSQGQAIGVLYVDNRFTSGAFSAEHTDLLEALADQAGIAIQTARLIARQRAMAEALAKSRREVEQLNAQLAEQLADVASALVDARADLTAQRHDLARRSEYAQIRGESAPLHRLFMLMDRVRDHDFPVLVRGESGTGKELVARAIHFTGRRKSGAFVAINCGAMPSNLLESELFGHARGAFTGAVTEHRGLFEAASGGTLLLDEVGDMPAEMQVKLLRVLQSGEIQRVGDSTVRRVEVRVVAATHRDLAALVQEGTFREDLLYRLRVVELEVPPLRRRLEDLPLLIEHFLAENRKAGVGCVQRVSPAALARLRQFSWPGNVRQLETTLKSACLFAAGSVLEAADVEPLLQRDRAVSQGVGAGAASSNWSSTATLAEIEAQVIRARLEAWGGNKRAAAESLGIDRGTLYNRLRG